MAKLHELLAVGNNLDNQSTKTVGDLKNTFEKKRHLFERKIVTFKPKAENEPSKTEAQSDIQTTVSKELSWITGILTRSIDVGHQIDVANTLAKADVVTEDGETILKDVPATSLLQLEKDLAAYHDLINAVPTLDPAKGFSEDTELGKGFYKARDVEKKRTKKLQKPLVLYPATKEHPAQAQLVTEDEETGIIQEQEWSALLTPSTKADLIDRVEMLTRAVKKARSRANEVDLDVASHKIGNSVFKYLLKPIN